VTRKTTPEEYDAWLEQDGRGFVALEPYVNSQTPILHKCPAGHEWRPSPTNIKAGKGCLHCAREQRFAAQTYSSEEYQDQLDAAGTGLTLVGEYLGDKTKLNHRCENGHDWFAAPTNVKRGTPCPECSGNKKGKWTLDALKADALLYDTIKAWRENSPSAYSTAKNKKLLPECTAHMQRLKKDNGYWTFERVFEDALQYQSRVDWEKGSPSGYNIALQNGWVASCCGHMLAPRSKQWSAEEYFAWAEENLPKIAVIGDYVCAKTAIKHRCHQCKYEWDATPDNIKNRGTGCPKCADYGFNPGKDGVLYIAEHRLKRGGIRVNVGITNNSFERRYTKADLSTVLRVHTIKGAGHFIADLVRTVLEAFAKCIDPAGLGLQKKVGTKECLKADFDEVVELALDAVGKG